MPNDHTILGFDFGLKYIGIAVGQTTTRSARALTTVIARAGVPPWEQISQLIQTWQPDSLVVGIPLNMDGSEQPLTHAAKQFAQQLTTRYQLPVHPMDERLSTREAREQLFTQGGYRALKKKTIDSLAAQLILESWLLRQS